MPIILYSCPCGHSSKKFFRQAKQAPASFLCEKCKKDMKKELRSPTNGSTIVIDNGVQARAVEIIPNIIELNEEKSNKDYRED